MARADEIEALARSLKKYARDIDVMKDRGDELWDELQKLRKAPAKPATPPATEGGDNEEDDGNPFR